MTAYPEELMRTIEYDSPSGKVNIGKWQPPFMTVPTGEGIGFMGLLVEDSVTGQLQCHVCGEWHEQLSTHVFGKHKMLSDEYRVKYGLLISTALKSMRIRMIHSKTIQRLQGKGKSCINTLILGEKLKKHLLKH